MAAPWAQGVRVRVLGKMQGQDCIQVIHFGTNTVVNDAPSRDALVLALLTAILACITEHLLAASSSDYKLNGVEGTLIYPSPGDPLFLAAPANTVGARGPASCSFITALIQVRTGLGGRTHRGRNFWAPPGEADTTNSTFSSSVMDELTAFVACVAGKFIGASATEQWRLGVLSRKLMNNDPSNFNQGFAEATGMVPSDLAAIMGTRKVGRGS